MDILYPPMVLTWVQSIHIKKDMKRIHFIIRCAHQGMAIDKTLY